MKRSGLKKQLLLLILIVDDAELFKKNIQKMNVIECSKSELWKYFGFPANNDKYIEAANKDVM